MLTAWPQDLTNLRSRFQTRPRYEEASSSKKETKKDQKKERSRKTVFGHQEVKTKQPRKKISSDGPIFRLHYQVTSVMLLASCFLLSCNLGFGSPIVCVGERFQFDTKDMEAYCLNFGIKKVHPTMSEYDYEYQDIHKLEEEVSKYNGWYKWTSLVLLAQAALFYIPHLVWKTYENGWIDNICKDLRATDMINAEEAKERLLLVAELYLKSKHLNKLYVIMHAACEVMNFLNVLAQLYTMNWMLSFYPMNHPIDILRGLLENTHSRLDPLEFTFPKYISCTLSTFGSSGTIETRSSHCEVPINYLNEICYIATFYWFTLLLLSTTVYLFVYRTFTMAPLYQQRCLQTVCKGVRGKVWVKLFPKLTACDLFVLRVMVDIMTQRTAEELINAIADEVRMRSSQKAKTTNEETVML